MKWTKETPTQPGWYWVRIDGFTDGIVSIRASGNGLLFGEGGEGTPLSEVLLFWQRLDKNMCWAGPISKPEEP